MEVLQNFWSFVTHFELNHQVWKKFMQSLIAREYKVNFVISTAVAYGLVLLCTNTYAATLLTKLQLCT